MTYLNFNRLSELWRFLCQFKNLFKYRLKIHYSKSNTIQVADYLTLNGQILFFFKTNTKKMEIVIGLHTPQHPIFAMLCSNAIIIIFLCKLQCNYSYMKYNLCFLFFMFMWVVGYLWAYTGFFGLGCKGPEILVSKFEVKKTHILLSLKTRSIYANAFLRL